MVAQFTPGPWIVKDEELYEALKLALAYIVDENETRKTSFAPYDDDDEDYIKYIKPGEEAIKAIGDILAKADGKQAPNAL